MFSSLDSTVNDGFPASSQTGVVIAKGGWWKSKGMQWLENQLATGFAVLGASDESWCA
jgi:hypothetical protein